MPEASVTGYWKGLAVTSVEHVIVSAYLEATGATIKGRYELEGIATDIAKGEITGSASGSEITLNSSHGIRFVGHITGEGRAGTFIHGLLERSGEGHIGTLTLIRTRPGEPSPVKAYA